MGYPLQIAVIDNIEINDSCCPTRRRQIEQQRWQTTGADTQHRRTLQSLRPSMPTSGKIRCRRRAISSGLSSTPLTAGGSMDQSGATQRIFYFPKYPSPVSCKRSDWGCKRPCSPPKDQAPQANGA